MLLLMLAHGVENRVELVRARCRGGDGTIGLRVGCVGFGRVHVRGRIDIVRVVLCVDIHVQFAQTRVIRIAHIVHTVGTICITFTAFTINTACTHQRIYTTNRIHRTRQSYRVLVIEHTHGFWKFPKFHRL